MSEQESIKVVDAFDLDDELRSLLKPGEMVRDGQGRRHRLPRYFYEIPTTRPRSASGSRSTSDSTSSRWSTSRKRRGCSSFPATCHAPCGCWRSTSSSSATTWAPRYTSPSTAAIARLRTSCRSTDASHVGYRGRYLPHRDDHPQRERDDREVQRHRRGPQRGHPHPAIRAGHGPQCRRSRPHRPRVHHGHSS